MRDSQAILPVAPAEFLPKAFDAKIIDDYYSKRPFKVWQRVVEIGSPLLSWWMAQKLDIITSILRSPAEQQALLDLRAAELKNAIIQGRSITFIKSGQALAARQDLLKSPAYLRELQKLHDEVGTFDNDVAMDIISLELGRPAEEIFVFDSPYPIASASIGQVYKPG
ncbi:AarF/ABC1/UbiB kinase family protein [archaeon]|nr:MAG: AarF/ABC1/UbiB kinase family protein [archaeon]